MPSVILSSGCFAERNGKLSKRRLLVMVFRLFHPAGDFLVGESKVFREVLVSTGAFDGIKVFTLY